VLEGGGGSARVSAGRNAHNEACRQVRYGVEDSAHVQKPSFNVEQILTSALFNDPMRVETMRDFQSNCETAATDSYLHLAPRQAKTRLVLRQVTAVTVMKNS
jgi:hypothetical protein